MAPRALLLVAALAALAGSAAAYPQLWVSYQIADDGLVADAVSFSLVIQPCLPPRRRAAAFSLPPPSPLFFFLTRSSKNQPTKKK
jgi:hypothetical protein